MDTGTWIALAIVFAVVLFAAAKVLHYIRLSRRQWQDVDRSKLKSWDDEEW